jgi:hypothetical protein
MWKKGKTPKTEVTETNEVILNVKVEKEALKTESEAPKLKEETPVNHLATIHENTPKDVNNDAPTHLRGFEFESE